MKHRSLLALTLGCAVVVAGAGWVYQRATAGSAMTDGATKFIATLSEEQKKQTVLPYDTPKRLEWHFIPKDERKGLQVKEMDETQRKALHALLQTALSEAGYDKTVKIMSLESILKSLEKGGRNIRDPERYYATIFGTPGEGKWGLSFEGHHLSLNFVVNREGIVSSTPSFFGANPAIVKSDVEGALPRGTRVLAKEETLAFELVNSLSDEQRGKAIIAEKAPSEIRAAGEPQPPTGAPEGLAFADMDPEQRATLTKLVAAYLENMPKEVQVERVAAMAEADQNKVHFAWAGALEPGVGHYYRVQGRTFLIEFVNVQPDAAGNVANHIHCVWRDMRGDFALPIAQAKAE
jgi:hypothetical protein